MINKNKLYGFDVMAGRWVERDEMLAINVKVFDEKNNARTIRIRLSKENHARVVSELEKLTWSGVTKYGSEIEDCGLPHEEGGAVEGRLALEVREVDRESNGEYAPNMDGYESVVR